jgi:rare lipoprotein A
MWKCLSLLLACSLILPYTAGQGQRAYHRPVGKVLEGIASYYGERFRGKKTHTDEVFDPDKLTAACNVLPLKTWVKVTNLRNHRSVTLWINDRMHPKNKRLIDVSAGAARKLGFYARGLTRVRVEVISPPR